MTTFIDIEIDLDDRRTLHAKVRETDESIHDLRGVIPRHGLEIENIEIQYFGADGWDDWYLPRPKDLQRYEKIICEWYFEQKEAG